MFEVAASLGNTEKSIALATRKGRAIQNFVELHPPPAHSIRQYELLVRKHGSRWRERKPPTGWYNCAGHVWASRRTAIFEPEEYVAIIADDGYHRLDPNEPVVVGDIAVYVDLDSGDEILHVGRVFGTGPGIAEGSKPIPLVISKWNSTCGESLHEAHDVPYNKDFNLEVRYFTDRPIETK